MKTREEILKVLRELSSLLRERYKVKRVWLFGSVLRAEHTPESDIDLLVDFQENADFLDLVGVGLFLEEKLKAKVDVATRAALSEEVKGAILAQAMSL